MRQFAFYSTTPDDAKECRGAKCEQIYPPLTWGEHLINALSELNFARSGGYGAVPIDFQEIKAYCDLTGTKFSPWEIVTLQKLSTVYCGERNNTDKHAYAPYMGEFSPKSFSSIREKFMK